MPERPPSSSRRANLAYAFYAAAIWALVAYSLWGPKPPSTIKTLVAIGQSCVR